MKKRWKIPFFLMVMLGLLFVSTSACKAWGPPKLEDEEAFLQWYEENKNNDGAVYQLSGDLKLTKGSEESPLMWDGQGKVTIDCGNHLILAESSLVINNPNLKITGSEYCVIMVRNETLTLEQGKIEYAGTEGLILQVQGGKLAGPSRRGQFTLCNSENARDVTGIVYGVIQDGVLSNLDIVLEGLDKAVGINSSGMLTVENCGIRVTAGITAYGIKQNFDTMELVVRDSEVTAAVSEPTGEAYSAYAESGKIYCENSVLMPKLEEDTTYKILAAKAKTPVYVEAGDSSADWQLPAELDMYVKETGSDQETELSIPVIWEVQDSVLDEPGYCIIKGSFDTQRLSYTVTNPDGVVPEVTVICLPPEKMFLIASEIEDTKTKLLLPYPYGAKFLKIEYSTDGRNFLTYLPNRPNMIIEGEPVPENGLFLFSVSLPEAQKGLYIRFVTVGESMFSGTSAVWKVGDGASTGIPDDAGEEQGGDRGGQDAEPDLPDANDPDTVPDIERPNVQPSVPDLEDPDAENGEAGGTPSVKPPSDGQGEPHWGEGDNQEEAGRQPGTTGNKEETYDRAPYVSSGVNRQEGNSVLGRGVDGIGKPENEGNRSNKPVNPASEEAVQHIDAEPDEKPLDVQNAELAEAGKKAMKKQYPIGIAVVLVVIGIAAAGYWYGKKVFKKK